MNKGEEYIPSDKLPTRTGLINMKRLVIPALGILIVAIVLAVVLTGREARPNSSGANSTQPVVHKYSNLTGSSLKTPLTTIDFKRPQEFTYVAKDSTLFKSDFSSSGANGKNQLAVIGSMSVYGIHPIVADNPPIDLGAARQSLNSGSGYQGYIKPLGINDFLSFELAHRYFGDAKPSQFNFSVDKPSVLTTPNLKQDAWQFGFSATGPGQDRVKVSGDLVFALGKSTTIYDGYNYVMLSAIDSNWQPNQQIWQQVIYSIKITDK